MLVAIVGTALIGPGTGVVGTPPLPPVPGRPLVLGQEAALVGDTVQFTYDDNRGTQLLTISQALASATTIAGGRSLAVQGTLMSDPAVSLGAPPQLIFRSL